jgi:hypothetical protein
LTAHVQPAAAANGLAVCTAANDQTRPVVVSDGSGGVIIAWHDQRPTVAASGVVFAQRLNAAGTPQWTANGVQLSTTGDTELPVIAPDGANGAFVAYGGDVQTRVQRVNAAGVPQWGADGTQLSNSGSSKRDVAITADLGGAGGAIVAWRENNATGGTNDIYAQKVNAAGVVQWGSNGVPVTATNMNNETLPALISDGAGGAIILWGGSAGLRAQRLNSSGMLQWGNTILAATVNNNPASVVRDGSTGVIVFWAGGGVFTQRIDATGNRLWNPPNGGVLLSTVGLMTRAVSDPVGGATVTWQDFRSGTNFNIYEQNVNSLGAAKYMSNGVEVCFETDDQVAPQIVSDGGSGVIITWYDARSGATGLDIYTQRMDTDGNQVWTDNGEPLCTATGDQEFPTIATDGASGAFVVWQDRRDGNADIYATRVNGSGIPLSVLGASGAGIAALSWPNPFSERVQLSFTLSVETPVRMDVFDVDGRRVRSHPESHLSPGPTMLTWDGRTDEGRRARAGIYFLQATGPGVDVTRRVVRLR